MTIPRLVELTNYWKNHPPVHVLVAAYIGFKPKEKVKNTDQDFNEFMNFFESAGGNIESG